eukprot:914774-Pelagomonas_calceolata.AAC.8
MPLPLHRGAEPQNVRKLARLQLPAAGDEWGKLSPGAESSHSGQDNRHHQARSIGNPTTPCISLPPCRSCTKTRGESKHTPSPRRSGTVARASQRRDPPYQPLGRGKRGSVGKSDKIFRSATPANP